MPASAPLVGSPRDLLALALLVPAPTVGAWAMLHAWPGSPMGQGLSFALKLWIAVLPVLWVVRVERRFDGSWLRLRGVGRSGWLAGVGTGAAIAAVMVLAYLAAEGSIDPVPLRAKAAQTGLDRPPRLLALFAYLVVVNSMLEEYIWRWFVVTRWERVLAGRRGAGVASVILSALCFTVHHVVALAAWVPPGINALASVGVFAGGVIWSWLFIRTRSVWPGYVSHAAADLAILWMAWRLMM